MIWLEILVLAVVQGITEFLPISSSGHLAVGGAVFKRLGYPIEERLTVHIVLHGGTLAAILVFYWKEIWRLLGREVMLRRCSRPSSSTSPVGSTPS